MARREKTRARLDREIAEALAKRRYHATRSTIALKLEDASEGARPGFRITAFDGDARVGAIVVRQHRWLPGAPFGVEHVYATRQRERIGTQLYEAAAREACRRGFPFMSDMERSPEADAFWRKQERKGRATRKITTLVDSEVDYFFVGCPAPSLD